MGIFIEGMNLPKGKEVLMGTFIEGMNLPKGKEVLIRIDENGEVYVYGNYPTELHHAIELTLSFPIKIKGDEK